MKHYARDYDCIMPNLVFLADMFSIASCFELEENKTLQCSYGLIIICMIVGSCGFVELPMIDAAECV